jgi:two-component system sensor histidine kinase/response regulator
VLTTGATGAAIGQACRMTIRMLIADDSPDYPELLELLLGPISEIEVVARAGNGADAVRLAAREQVDAALIDINMPGLDGFEAADAIKRSGRSGSNDRSQPMRMCLVEADCGLLAARRFPLATEGARR